MTHELDIVRKLNAARVPLLAGTDTAAGVDVIPGISLHLELRALRGGRIDAARSLADCHLKPGEVL